MCNGVAIPFAQGTATIELTRKDPQVHCVFTNAFSAKPPVPPKPTPVPPNPTPVPPVPPNPQTPGGAYDIADLIVTKVASAPVVTRGQVIGFRITVKTADPALRSVWWSTTNHARRRRWWRSTPLPAAATRVGD